MGGELKGYGYGDEYHGWVIPPGSLLMIRKDPEAGFWCTDLTPPNPASPGSVFPPGPLESLLPRYAAEKLTFLLDSSSDLEPGCCFYAFLHEDDGHHLVPITICLIQGGMFTVIFGDQVPSSQVCTLSYSHNDMEMDFPDMVSRMSTNLEIISATPAAFRYFGIESHRLVGHSYRDYVHPDDLPSLEDILITLSSGHKLIRLKYRIKNNHGEYRWVETEFCSISDPLSEELTEILSATHDIDSLIRSGDAARKSNEKLNLLYSFVRHDAMNLIMGLSGYLEILLDIVKDDEVRMLLHKKESMMERLKRLFDLTRKYQGIGAKPPGWIDIHSVLTKIFTRHEYAGKFEYTAQVDGLYIYADRLFEHVIHELLANSLTFCEENIVITVDYRIEDEGLILSFSDNGPGIRLDEKERIFMRSSAENAGYGLYLSTEILDITGIKIREAGVFGEGACFEMIVPPDGYRIARFPDVQNTHE